MEFIVRLDSGLVGSRGWVEPDGPDPRVKASFDVRSQAVSYDHGFFLLKIRDPGKAGVKVGGVWLVPALPR